MNPTVKVELTEEKIKFRKGGGTSVQHTFADGSGPENKPITLHDVRELEESVRLRKQHKIMKSLGIDKNHEV